MLTFCGWTPHAILNGKAKNQPAGIMTLLCENHKVCVWGECSWRSSWALKWTMPPSKRTFDFSPGLGLAFWRLLARKPIFPSQWQDFLGKINSSSYQEQRKRQGSHAINQVTREQPKKISSAGDNVCMQRWRWVESKAERESKLENLWGKDGNNGTQNACRGGLNPRECRRKTKQHEVNGLDREEGLAAKLLPHPE